MTKVIQIEKIEYKNDNKNIKKIKMEMVKLQQIEY